MSYIETAGRDALVKTTADRESARRAFLITAALLLLLHILTITPYIHTTEELANLVPKVTKTKEVFGQLEKQSKDLTEAKATAERELKSALGLATNKMRQSFGALTVRISGQRNQPFQSQTVIPTLPNEQSLAEIIQAVHRNEAGSDDRLKAYARSDIVLPAYEDANQAWKSISSVYLKVIDNTNLKLSEAEVAVPDEADALRDAKGLLDNARQQIASIAISPDSAVDQVLGSEWWTSVEGKAAQANAVVTQVQRQLDATSILDKAVAAITDVMAKQNSIQNQLNQQQIDLEKQLEEARNDIVSIAGSSAVVPIHAKTLIGLFPLVLGAVLGFMILRIAQSRRAAVEAAGDLATVSKDKETQLWLLRRALGDKKVELLEVVFACGAATAWIVVAAVQIYGVRDLLKPPLPVWGSALTGVVILGISSAWDYVNLQHLEAFVHQVRSKQNEA